MAAALSRSPDLSQNYHGNRFLANAEFGSQFVLVILAAGIFVFNFAGLVHRKFMFGMTIFANCIGNIFGLSANPKMIRIDAKHDIAPVADFHPFWDWATKQLKTHPVGQDASWKSSVWSNTGSGPQPASRSLVDAFQKSMLGGNSVHRKSMAGWRTYRNGRFV